MALDPRIASARRLRKNGSSLTEVANAYGVSRATILRWTNPEVAQRDREISRRWKANNPEAAARHNNNLTGTCIFCGGLTARRGKRCAACFHANRAERAERKKERIVTLWRLGLTAKQIATALGTTQGTVFVQLSRMRSEGRNVPRRYVGRG